MTVDERLQEAVRRYQRGDRVVDVLTETGINARALYRALEAAEVDGMRIRWRRPKRRRVFDRQGEVQRRGRLA